MLDGLPRDALIHTPLELRGKEPWTLVTELLAQAVEELSVSTAGYSRRQPIKVPRPDYVTQGADVRRPAGDQGSPNPFRAAMDRMLAHKPSRAGERQ